MQPCHKMTKINTADAVKRYRRDGVVVRASASQSVDLGFISRVQTRQKTLENGIHSSSF